MKWSGRLASDFLSIAASQFIAAIGQLVGVRVLTEVLSPLIFGQTSLMVGVVALGTTALLNPTLQTLLRYYPAQAQAGDPLLVERVAIRRIRRILTLVIPLSVPLGVLAVAVGWCSPLAAVLLMALMAVEGLRLYRTTIMNAARQHHRYGIWMIGEAWGRPLIALLATRWLGSSVEIVLGAFILPSLVLYGVIGRAPDSPNAAPVRDEPCGDDLFHKFRIYSNPLIPLGILGWVSGMADRYLIAGMLSSRDVGIYAAAYGLASRPLLMLATVAETSIRPAYYAAVGRSDRSASRKYLLVWLGVVITAGLAACALFAFFHRQLAQLLLGPQFREASPLMPWIAGGYAVLALYHIPVRICLAHDAPHSVTITEAAGAAFAVVIGFIFIKAYGLMGAAVAVPVYFGIQLLASTYLAARSVQRVGG